MPLPRPVGFAAGDEYKLALAFDGDRFLTPWLPVLGKRAAEVPLLQVELVRRAALRVCCHAALTRAPQTHTGGYLSAVHATAQAVPASYLRLHAELIQVRPCSGRPACLAAHAPLQEFRNSSHWPKHVLVHYSWREVSEVDSVAGLYVLFLAGARSAAGACSAVRANPPARRSGAVGPGTGQRDAGQRSPADALLLRGCGRADAGQPVHHTAGVRRKSGLIRRRL